MLISEPTNLSQIPEGILEGFGPIMSSVLYGLIVTLTAWFMQAQGSQVT